MRLIVASAFLVLTSLSAQAAPPEGTKLADIIAKVEQAPGTQYVDEVDWNDRGYYEIEYFNKDGAKVEIKVDPKTGENVK